MKLSFAFEWISQFEELDVRIKKQILSKLKEIDRIDSWPHEALKGRQFKGLFKIRIGDYRLIYRLVDGTTMDFLYLGHRREIYN
jgi:mRNA-degrading endonuclease RelE of RelBE toxin-antitoxin system